MRMCGVLSTTGTVTGSCPNIEPRYVIVVFTFVFRKIQSGRGLHLHRFRAERSPATEGGTAFTGGGGDWERGTGFHRRFTGVGSWGWGRCSRAESYGWHGHRRVLGNLSASAWPGGGSFLVTTCLSSGGPLATSPPAAAPLCLGCRGAPLGGRRLRARHRNIVAQLEGEDNNSFMNFVSVLTLISQLH